MLSTQIVLTALVVYAMILCATGWFAEHLRQNRQRAPLRSILHGLSLATLCSSWTYFAAIGDARGGNWLYVANALGPILAITVAFPVWKRIAVLSKQENVGSLADFLSARYGKSRSLGVLVTCVVTFGAMPYIALQLTGLARAWSFSLTSSLSQSALTLSLLAVLVLFSLVFGTRRPSLTQHSRGLVSMVALESCIKLGALLCVAIAAIVALARAPSGLSKAIAAVPSIVPVFDMSFVTMTLLCTATAFTLPRQFHLGFVTLEDVEDVRMARRMVPVYFTLWPLATLLIALPLRSGFAPAGVSPDLLLLSLARQLGGNPLELTALLGGFSAGAAMVVVELTAISAMVSNELVLPCLVASGWRLAGQHPGGSIVTIRRCTTIGVAVLAWSYCYGLRNSGGPTHLGLTALAASAQLFPALIGGIFWRRGHAEGAIAGILGGFGIWAAATAAPSFFTTAASSGVISMTPAWSFQLPILLSLSLNAALYVLVSLRAKPSLVDAIQSASFVETKRGAAPDARALSATLGDLRRLLGQFMPTRDVQRILDDLQFGAPSLKLSDDTPVSATMARSAERMLAGVLGASSARNVMSLALAAGSQDAKEISKILDEAAHVVQFSRELLQTTLDSLDHGVSVSDRETRLIAWNASYLTLMGLPAEQIYIGKPLNELLRFMEEREGDTSVSSFIARRLEAIEQRSRFQAEVTLDGGRTVRITGAPLGAHDFVATFVDITDLKQAEFVLTRSNEELEHRVQERTAELMAANRHAERITSAQRRFIAAASHDLVQPLYAARLFIGNAVADAPPASRLPELLTRADQAVEGAHRLLRALLNLSQLETGALRPNPRPVCANDMLVSLAEEFTAQAALRGLELIALPTSCWISTDPDLLRSMLQNLLVNAIRYTPRGRVLLACRRAGAMVRLEVRDTGVGISPEALPAAFAEFTRLAQGRSMAEGAGLGLSIVARISEVLEHPVTVRSRPGQGSVFSVLVPRAEQDWQPQPLLGATIDLAGLRVLCLDDEPDVLLGTKGLIERWGALCTAFETASKLPPHLDGWDVVIADFHLDGEDGLTVLRRCPSGTNARLLVTAMPDEGLQEQLAAEGIEVLQKPVPPLVLQSFLARALALRQLEEDERSSASAIS